MPIRFLVRGEQGENLLGSGPVMPRTQYQAEQLMNLLQKTQIEAANSKKEVPAGLGAGKANCCWQRELRVPKFDRAKRQKEQQIDRRLNRLVAEFNIEKQVLRRLAQFMRPQRRAFRPTALS